MSNEAKVHILDLSFKGERDYLHGTDIIPALVELTGPAKNVIVQIHRKTSHQLSAQWVDELKLSQMRKEGNICVLMSYETLEGIKKYIVVTEDPSKPVKTSKPYDEEKVITSSKIQENSITQESYAVGSLIERIVALNKSLLTDLEGHASWLFCGIELKNLPDDRVPLEISFKNKFGRGLFKSIIVTKDEEIGCLTFVENIQA